MLIAIDVSLVDIQRLLGHRKPDTTLRVYAHQWKFRDAQWSGIGAKLECLFEARSESPGQPRSANNPHGRWSEVADPSRIHPCPARQSPRGVALPPTAAMEVDTEDRAGACQKIT
jgi:hypothetical protein